jgi:hypothetical protein
VGFGYHSKIEGYTTLMSDIPKLGDRGYGDKKLTFLIEEKIGQNSLIYGGVI